MSDPAALPVSAPASDPALPRGAVIPFPLAAARPPALRRPRALVRAARAGQAGWKRGRDLPRLLRCESAGPVGSALPRLRAEEELVEHARQTGSAPYDLQRHVLLLIAILAELRAMAQEAAARSATAARGIAR